MQNYISQITNSLLKLLSYPSMPAEPMDNAPYGKDIDDTLKCALKLCADLGFKVYDNNGLYGYADVGGAKAGPANTFAVLCHLDVVPYIKSQWKYSPLGELANGNIYGRGALDDKGPTVAAIFAAKRLLDEGVVFKKNLRFIFGLDEENGEWKSVEHYIKNHGMPSMGIAPDSDFPVICSEKGVAVYSLKLDIPVDCQIVDFSSGERYNIVPSFAKAEAKGLPETQYTALGKSAHGSRPFDGENAAVKLIKELADKKIAPFDLLYDTLYDYNGRGLKIDCCDEVSGCLTANAGVFAMQKQGDKSVLEIHLDVRYPHCITLDELTKKLEKNNPAFDICLMQSHRPLYVEESHPLVKGLLKAYRKVTGDYSPPLKIGGATFARALDCAVAFGPTFPNQHAPIHQEDEYISVENLAKTAEIYYEAIKEMVG